VTIRIKDEVVKKAIEQGNFKCATYILNGIETASGVEDTMRHLLAVFRISYNDAQLYPTDEELLEKIFDEVNADPLSRSFMRETLLKGTTAEVHRFYCSKMRSIYGIPEEICQSCKVHLRVNYATAKDVVQYVIRAIKEVTTDGETVTIYLASERVDGVSIPVRYKYSDIVKFVYLGTPSPDSNSWEKTGRPAIEVSRLFSIATGVLPIAEITNADARVLWEDVIQRMKLEVDDPGEIIRIISDSIREAIPEDLNEIDPNSHMITPSLLNYFADLGTVYSPRFVLKERNGVLRVWIHGKYIQSTLALALGRELDGKALKSIILDLGGRTSVKLGIGPSDIKGRRGYEIPVTSLSKDLQEKLKEYYGRAEELGKVKLKNLGGGGDA